MVEEEEKKGVAVSAAVSSSLPPRIGQYSPTLKNIWDFFLGGGSRKKMLENEVSNIESFCGFMVLCTLNLPIDFAE